MKVIGRPDGDHPRMHPRRPIDFLGLGRPSMVLVATAVRQDLSAGKRSRITAIAWISPTPVENYSRQGQARGRRRHRRLPKKGCLRMITVHCLGFTHLVHTCSPSAIQPVSSHCPAPVVESNSTLHRCLQQKKKKHTADAHHAVLAKHRFSYSGEQPGSPTASKPP